jgi:hypothetical protein
MYTTQLAEQECVSSRYLQEHIIDLLWGEKKTDLG